MKKHKSLIPKKGKYYIYKWIKLEFRKDPKKSAAKKDNPFQINYEKFKTKEEAVEKLMTDVRRFKVALPDHITTK